MTETKPTNGFLTDRLNNTRTKNRPIWLTIDGSKPTNDWWQTLHESFSQYHHGYTDQSRSTDQTYNIIDWQTLFTWLWRWLTLRLSKRQSPTTVLFRTTPTRTILLFVCYDKVNNNCMLFAGREVRPNNVFIFFFSSRLVQIWRTRAFDISGTKAILFAWNPELFYSVLNFYILRYLTV